MRTRKFQRVFDRIVRLHGRDPNAEINHDMAQSLVEHINVRVREVWEAWRWPEWERTEERAFRTVWNDSRQFVRVGADGNPDEVYYIPNQTYYRVIASAASDPPIGTPPTDGNYFELIETPMETFIEYDQAAKRAIGIMRGVYRSNPRVPSSTGCNMGLRYMPSERGIDICGTGTPTVWITYSMPVPQYTTVPWVAGKTYEKADIIFYPATGECFQAVIETTAVPTNTTYWRWIPFLDVWTEYVTTGAFSDSLLEFDQGGNDDLQAKAALQQFWNQRAERALEKETDTLAIQGQVLKWSFCRSDGWCNSLPWCGGEVITIATAPFSSIITDELPSGVIDTANTIFTTAYPFSTIWVFLNGVKQTKTTDYTLNNQTGFTMIVPPTTGDLLVVDYIRA